ncbi:P-loop NTPase [Haloplanus halophilus]|uniref:P-loop NTPase n=1 Tax=Haloplanus halophilus TaxID=2949993 RepID=UPI00203D56A2|nr:P-loop NTPase [Haloplanus sp. GDY1]
MREECGCGGHGDGDDPSLRDRIEAALSDVEDPDLGAGVLESGLVTGLSCRDGEVRVAVEFAGLPAPAAEEVEASVREAVLSVPGVEGVRVDDGERPASGRPQGHDAGRGDGTVPLPDVDRVVAVASAKGGVGKTTVAVALARALDAAGESVGLFDADLHGPNVPARLGVSGPVTTTEAGDAAPVDADGIATMSVGLLAGDDPVAWRGAMAHEALTDLCAETAWGDLDTLVVDLPPGTGDVVLTSLSALPLTGAVLVTTPDPSAVGDTVRSERLFREEGVPVLGVVPNMTAATCPDCGTEHAVFPTSDVGEAFSAPVLDSFPVDPALADPETAGDRAAELARAVREATATDPVPPEALDLRGVPARAAREQLGAERAALDPGESLRFVTATAPAAVREALPDGDDPRVIDRLGPERWLLELPAESDAGAGAGEVTARGGE